MLGSWFPIHFNEVIYVLFQNRSFMIYSYAATRGLLLLRSWKTNATPTRLDVLFQDVRAMGIRAWFDGIEIEEESAQLLDGVGSNPRIMLEPGNKVYKLKGNGWSRYVIGRNHANA